MKLKHALSVALATISVGAGVILTQSNVALAHHATVTGTATCVRDQSGNATGWKVDWIADASNDRDKWKITESGWSPSTEWIDVSANRTKTTNHTLNEGSASQTATVRWAYYSNVSGDGINGPVINGIYGPQSDTETLNKPTGCNAPKSTTVTWTATNGTCVSPNGSLTVIPGANATYVGSPSGSYAPSTLVEGTFTAKPDYVINGQTTFSHTFGVTGAPCSIPNNPQVQISKACGSWSAVFTNAVSGIDAWETVADATFTLVVDGVPQAIVVPANQTVTQSGTFGEDSGSHTVAVGAQSVTVDTNCLADQILPPILTATYDCVSQTSTWNLVVPQGSDSTKWTAGPVTLDANSQTYSVTITAIDGFTFPAGKSIVLTATFVVDNRCEVTAVDPTVDHTTVCQKLDTYTIPNTPGVTYLKNGTPIAAGTYDLAVDESVTITASADANRRLTNPAFSVTITGGAVEDCVVVPPTITGSYDCVADGPATFTLSPASGNWTASGDQDDSKLGIKVTITAKPGYTFAGARSSVVLELVVVESDDCEVTAVEPTIDHTSECHTVDSYTIPNTPGVTYLQDGSPVSAGTYDLATGDSVVITAQAAQGKRLTNPEFSVTLTGGAIEDCVIQPPAISGSYDCVADGPATFTLNPASGNWTASADQDPSKLGIKVTITANAGYTFAGGATTVLTLTVQESDSCESTPAAPTVTPPTCSAPGSVVTTDTEAYSWTKNEDGTYTAVAKQGFRLVGPTTFGPFDTAQLTGQQCVEPKIEVAAFSPVCDNDVPYIGYEIKVSGTDHTTAKITLRDNRGEIVAVHEGAPLVGRFLYPGATDDPKDWPGWKEVGGKWVLDDKDHHWRLGLTVHVEVNPEADAAVTYPDATPACFDPPQQETPTTTTTTVASEGPVPPIDPVPSLPKTGSNSTGMAVTIGAMLLLGGLALLTVVRRPRRS